MLAFCDNINTVAVAGKLRGFSDPQIANGMCEVLAVGVEIIARDDDPGQSCVAAAKEMFTEFHRRFPSHDPQEVIGRC